jgi:S-adenosylmethionine synthetase
VKYVDGAGRDKEMQVETFTWEKLDYVDKVKAAFGL